MISGEDDLWSMVYFPTSLPLPKVLPVAYRALNAITPGGSLASPASTPARIILCIPIRPVSTVLFRLFEGKLPQKEGGIRVQRGHHKINPIYVGSSELGELYCLIAMHGTRTCMHFGGSPEYKQPFGNIGSTNPSHAAVM